MNNGELLARFVVWLFAIVMEDGFGESESSYWLQVTDGDNRSV